MHGSGFVLGLSACGSLLAIGPALSLSTARADCGGVYSVDKMVEDLISVETFLRNGDDAMAGEAAVSLQEGLPCMNEVLPRMIVGRALRAVGGGLVASGDADAGEDWLRTAAEIEQSFDFGLEDLPEVHKIRDVYADAKSTSGGEEVVVAGATLAAGTVYLDGRKVLEAKARLDRWHVLQLDDGSSVKSWVMEGNRFPDAVLVSAAPVVAGKKPKTPKPAPGVTPPKPVPVPVAVAPKPAPAPRPTAPSPVPRPTAPRPTAPLPNPGAGSIVVARDRPWEKTPLMIGGGAIVAAGAGVYYASYVSKQKFVHANDDDVLVELQSKTNRLFIAAYAVLGVGAGTLTWGVILDGDAGPLPGVRFRV